MKYIVGDWIFDSSNEQLTCEQQCIKPRLKVIQLLTCLLQNPGRVVTRNELIEQIWAGNHHVGEKALNSVVYTLRNILNDQDKTFNAIETIPKRGYRLTVTASEIKETPVKQKWSLPSFFQPITITRGAIMAGLLILSTVSAVLLKDDVVSLSKTEVVTTESGLVTG
ncbi:MAG: winged helix-turn-helix transcriptional regulator [Algicola sp.]|nr:winged helix-turn-helix transcriptional regulator [Algicola sp.]